MAYTFCVFFFLNVSIYQKVSPFILHIYKEIKKEKKLKKTKENLKRQLPLSFVVYIEQNPSLINNTIGL